MITEDYVSFETAKLLKEKGFTENCLMRYNKAGGLVEESYKFNWNFQTIDYSAPTLQMVMKWLREKYNIVISIIFISDQKREDRNSYSWIVYTADTFKWNTKEAEKSQVSYELACEAAIRYCLENII